MNEDDGSQKRKRKVEDDLICPIALELPFDPVIAADGRVYERNAIEEYFKGKKNESVIKSPMTNMPLKNQDLLDATQHRNLIETSIENGVITGELAKKWTRRAKAKETLIKKAEGGDGLSICCMLSYLHNGTNGFKKNLNEVHTLAWRFHNAGNVVGTFYLAFTFLNGEGTERDTQKGIMYLALCAREYDLGSYWLGAVLAKGLYGVKKDRKDAIQHVERALSGKCPIKLMRKDTKELAKSLLEKLKQETG